METNNYVNNSNNMDEIGGKGSKSSKSSKSVSNQNIKGNKDDKDEKKKEKKDDNKEGNKDDKDEKDKDKEDKKKGEKEKEGEKGNKGEKSEGKKSNNGCPESEPDCVAKEIAEVLVKPGNSINKLKEKAGKALKETVIEAGHAFKVALTSPPKCVLGVVQSIPTIIDNIGNKTIGLMDKASDGIDKFTGSIKRLFDELGSRSVKGYPDIFGPLEVLYAYNMANLQKIIDGIILGKDAEKILSDPRLYEPKKLLEKMKQNSEKYKNVANNAEFKEEFTKWITDYVGILLETFDLAKPKIDEVKSELESIITGFGEGLGHSVETALGNVLSAAFLAIPGLGLVLAAVNTGQVVGNKFLESCDAVTSSKAAGMALEGANEILKQKNLFEDKLNCLKNKVGPLFEKGVPTIAVPTIAVPIKQSGGAFNSIKKNKLLIKKTTKRINRLLKRMTRRRR